MKRFEIINNTWISQLVFPYLYQRAETKEHKPYLAIRISEIMAISTDYLEKGEIYYINLCSHSLKIVLGYEAADKEDFQNDLDYFIRLLSN